MSDLIDNDPYEEADLPSEEEELTTEELNEFEDAEIINAGGEPQEASPQGSPRNISEALTQILSEQAPVNPEEAQVEPDTDYQPEYNPYAEGGAVDPYQVEPPVRAELSEQDIDVALAQTIKIGMMTHPDFQSTIALLGEQFDDPAFRKGMVKTFTDSQQTVQVGALANKLYGLGKQIIDRQGKRATADLIAHPVSQPGTMYQSSHGVSNPFAGKDINNMTMEEFGKLREEAIKRGGNFYKKLIGEA